MVQRELVMDPGIRVKQGERQRRDGLDARILIASHERAPRQSQRGPEPLRACRSRVATPDKMFGPNMPLDRVLTTAKACVAA